VACLLEQMNTQHRLQLILHFWKAATVQQIQSCHLKELTFLRIDWIIERFLEEGILHNDQAEEEDEDTLEWLSEEIAVQLKKLPVDFFFSLKRGIFTWGPWLQGVFKRARIIAAIAFVNEQDVITHLDMYDPSDYAR